jgi:hypothetical protein
MPYKSYLSVITTLVVLFFISSFNSISQTGCYTEDSGYNKALSFNTAKSSGYTSDPNTEYHIPVYVISFRDALGNFESMSAILDGLDIMVDDFLPMNIFLEVGCVIELVDGNVTSEEILSNNMDVYLENNYVHPNGITIFVFGPNHAATSWGPTGSFNGGYSLQAASGERYIYMGGTYPYEPTLRAVETRTFSHEMGHAFGLEHTSQSNSSSNTNPALGACRELVDGSNCEECGDYICSTPASYGVSYSNLANCSESVPVYEVGTGSLYTPIVTNTMEYATSQCVLSFTMGNGDQYFSQESRMKYFLDNDPWLITVAPFSLPASISVCSGNFQALCGPEDDVLFDYSYQWYFNNPITQTSVLVSGGTKGGPCYTPTQYGSYTLIVTDQYGCQSSHTVNVIVGFGPIVTIDNIYYCNAKGSPFMGAPPSSVGLTGPYSDALSYSWTYDDWSGSGPLSQAYTGYQIPYLGDGDYCVTIAWSDENVSSLLGCTSEACFEVKECCQPNPECTIDWVEAGTASTLTVQNNPFNTGDYEWEEFALYMDCDGNGWIPSGIPSVIRTSLFNDPVTFTGLNASCDYKVVHRVTSFCLQQSFVFQISVSGDLKVAVFPNPASSDSPLNIKMLSKSETSNIEIYNIITGALVFEGVLNYEEPTMLDQNKLRHGQYHVKVYNEDSVVYTTLIIK